MELGTTAHQRCLLLLLLVVGLSVVEATAASSSLPPDWPLNGGSREGLSEKFLVGCALFRNEAPFLVHIPFFSPPLPFPAPSLLG